MKSKWYKTMNNNLYHKKIIHEEKEYHVIMHKMNKVSLGYLPKIIDCLTANIVHNLNNYQGEIIWINGKNIVHFPNQEKTQEAIEYLYSVMVMEKLK